jgi:hypothetical protein
VGPIQNATWTESLAFFGVEVVKVDGQELVVKGVKGEVFVPGAFVVAKKAPKNVKVGAPVLVQRGASMIAGTKRGRIKAITKDEGETSYTAQTRFVSDIDDDEGLAPEEVIVLDGKVGFGAPVAWKTGDDWEAGVYVSAGPGGKDSAWVLAWAGKLTQVSGVKPLTVTKVFKKGDKVWADRFSKLRPATVVEVLAGGVAYKVRFEKDSAGKEEEDTLDLGRVTTPL